MNTVGNAAEHGSALQGRKPVIDFTGRRVLIAGGSKGIGREMALAFAAAGAQVSACARGQAGLDALQADAHAQGTSLHTFATDLADIGQIQVWLDAAANALGGIDVLVNNATGYGMADDEDGWAASLQIDLMAAVRASPGTALAARIQRCLHPQPVLDRRTAATPRRRTLRRRQGRAVALHHLAGTGAGQGPDPGQRHRTRFHRIRRWPVGSPPHRRPRAVPRHRGEDPVRPLRPSARDCRRGPVPVLAAGALDHRPCAQCGRRPGVDGLNL